MEVHPDDEAVAKRLAARIAEAVAAGDPPRHICLAGGGVPMRAHELLDALVDDWEGVHLWFGDERCVPPGDPDSNFGQADARLKAAGAVWHRIPGELGPDDGAAEYASMLGELSFDLVVLGMGPDGHTASLFPGFPQLGAEGSVVGVRDAPKPPPDRISLTLATLNAGARIVLAATGEAKRDALARVVVEPAEPTRDVPASLLARERLLVLTDRAALPLG